MKTWTMLKWNKKKKKKKKVKEVKEVKEKKVEKHSQVAVEAYLTRSVAGYTKE